MTELIEEKDRIGAIPRYESYPALANLPKVYLANIYNINYKKKTLIIKEKEC